MSELQKVYQIFRYVLVCSPKQHFPVSSRNAPMHNLLWEGTLRDDRDCKKAARETVCGTLGTRRFMATAVSIVLFFLQEWGENNDKRDFKKDQDVEFIMWDVCFVVFQGIFEKNWTSDTILKMDFKYSL